MNWKLEKIKIKIVLTIFVFIEFFTSQTSTEITF